MLVSNPNIIVVIRLFLAAFSVISFWFKRLTFYAIVLKIISVLSDFYYFYSRDEMTAFSIWNDYLFRELYVHSYLDLLLLQDFYIWIILFVLFNFYFVSLREGLHIKPEDVKILKKKNLGRGMVKYNRVKNDIEKLKQWMDERQADWKNKESLIDRQEKDTLFINKYLNLIKTKSYKKKIKKIKKIKKL